MTLRDDAEGLVGTSSIVGSAGPVDLTTAAVSRFGSFRGLTRVMRRIKIESRFALRAAEGIRLPVVVRLSGRGIGIDVHAADGIFYSCRGLHCCRSRFSGNGLSHDREERGVIFYIQCNAVTSPGKKHRENE